MDESNRKSIKVRSDLHEQMIVYCDANGYIIRRIYDRAIEEFLARVEREVVTNDERGNSKEVANTDTQKSTSTAS